MAAADMELQVAIVACLKAYAPLTAVIADRIYDHVPVGGLPTGVPEAEFPYLTMGETDSHRADATCVAGEELYLTLHAWSRNKAVPEARLVADLVREALHRNPLTLPTNRLISLNHQRTRSFRDPDGVTLHAVIQLLAYVEKP